MNHPIPQRTLVVHPDDGVEPVLELLAEARKALRVKQFTLSEPRIVQGLMDAHRRGVAVRVMLNPHRSSGDRPEIMLTPRSRFAIVAGPPHEKP